MDCTHYAFLRKNSRVITLLILSLCCLLSASFFFFTGFFVHAETASDTQSPELKSASVSLKDDIVLHYYLSLPDGVTSPSLTFSLDGRTTVVSSFSKEEKTGLYKFSFSGITPQLIFSPVSAILNYTQNDETKTLTLPDYSISEYCEKLLIIDLYEGLSDKKLYALKALAVDILKYGKAASALVNSEDNIQLSLSSEALALSNIYNDNDNVPTSKNVEETTDNRVVWTAAGVSFSSCVSVYFKAKVKTEDLDSLKFTILHPTDETFVNSTNYTVTPVDEEYSIVKFYSNGISPKFFTIPLRAQITLDNKDYGGYCEYSVSSCVKSNISDTKYSDFVKSVFAYGKSAVLYENIDNLEFTSIGSIETNDYKLTATKDNYNFSIAYPSIYSDNYTLEKSDNGKCKFILSSGHVYDGFGKTESGETDIPTYIKIGNKLFTTDFSNLPENISASEDNGTLTITLDNYNSADPLSVCAPNGAEITLNGNNYICYETVQKSFYSPVNVTFLDAGSLSCGVIQAENLTVSEDCSLQISTGETTGSGYALKTALNSAGYVEIVTKLNYGVILTGDSYIENSEVNISATTIGITGDYSLTVRNDLTTLIITAENGISIEGKFSISGNARIFVTAQNSGIQANTISLSATLNISTAMGTAISTNTVDKNSFKSSCKVNLSSQNNTSPAVKIGICDELILQGEFCIKSYKNSFYTELSNIPIITEGKFKQTDDSDNIFKKLFGFIARANINRGLNT